MKSKIDKEKRKKEKSWLKKRATEIKVINKFIADSNRTLSILHMLPTKSKQDITLAVAEVTKACSLYAKDTQLRILQTNLEITRLSIEEKDLLSKNITGNLFQRIVKKIGISIASAKNKQKTIAAQNLLSQYEEDSEILSKALQICAEYGRRLSFYLSF